MVRRYRISALALVALAACSSPTTRQAPTVKPSGFLGDYSRLQPGGPDRALLVYRAPDLSFAGYDKVILDPVTVWLASGMREDVSRADLQRLADLMYGNLLVRLQTYYLMVREPGPKTLRIRAALTELTPSGGVGAASAEVQILDAETGKELLAAADRRVGESTLTGSSDPWGAVTEAIRVWADAFMVRLQQEGGRTRTLPSWALPPR